MSQITIALEVLVNPALLVLALLDAGVKTESFAWLAFVHNLRDCINNGVWDKAKLNDKAESWKTYYAEWSKRETTQRKYFGAANSPAAIDSKVVPFSATQPNDSRDMWDYLVSEYGVKDSHKAALIDAFKQDVLSMAIDAGLAGLKGKSTKAALNAVRKAITNEFKNRKAIVESLAANSPAANSPAVMDMAAMQQQMMAAMQQQMAAMLAQMMAANSPAASDSAK